MPTSVGPKTYGKDNLVFGYDTSDTKNSYKGEPTENLVDAFPDTSLPSGFYWTYEYSASISDSPIDNHFLSDKKWVKLTKTSATNGRVLFNQNSFTSGSTYTITAYAFINDSRNTALAFNSDNGGYSQETVDVPYNFNYTGTVQRIRGTWNQLQNGGSIYGLRGGSTNAIGSTIYLTGLQVEENGHPTQLTQGIRSANSGSLIDLTGNSTIDLTNVSFDSNAQMTFDGTNDYASTSVLSMGTPSAITLECVIRFSGTLDSNDRKVMHYDKTGTTNAVFQLRKGTTNSQLMYQAHDGTTWYTMTDTDAIESDTWVHIICTHSGTFGVMYKNGTQSATQTMGILDWTNANNILIGYRAAAEYWKGDIAMMKIYNRALTASEIKANYNAIKGRFNI